MAETFCSSTHRASVEDTTWSLATGRVEADATERLCSRHRRVFHPRSASLPLPPKWPAQLAPQRNLTTITLTILPHRPARAATKSASVSPTPTAQSNQRQSSNAHLKARNHWTSLKNTPKPRHPPKLWELAMCPLTPRTRKRYFSSSNRASRVYCICFASLISCVVALTPRACSTVSFRCQLRPQTRRLENLRLLRLSLHLRRRSHSAHFSAILLNILYGSSR